MPRQELRKEEVLAEKRARVPVNENRERLTTRGLDHKNFAYRFVNISNQDRVNKFLDAGYQFVRKGGGMVGDAVVNSAEGTDSLITTSGGQGVKLALMAIPREFYEADQALKDNKIKEIERTMKRDLASKADPSKGGLGEFKIDNKLGFDDK